MQRGQAGLMVVALVVASVGCGEERELRGRRESRGPFTVVWLEGTPYEMGRQQARLLHDELAEGIRVLREDILFQLMAAMADELGLFELAATQSYPEIVAECEGLVEGLADLGWTMDDCMVLNFGDVVVENAMHDLPAGPEPPGCSQLFVTGAASGGAGLLHGRLLDWARIEYVINHPVIFVRQPRRELAHVVIGFPGNLSPYSGMNAAGLSVASNEIEPPSPRYHRLEGRSHVQMVARMLATADSLDEARAMALGTPHLSHESIAVADGPRGAAEVFELSPNATGVRALVNDVLFTTNHFIAPETEAHDEVPPSQGSRKRFDRFGELALPGGSASLYGELDHQGVARVLRDRLDPWTRLESAADVFDDSSTLATNGALYAIVFDGARRQFWVSAGVLPVPQQPLIGFSLDELLGLPEPAPLLYDAL